MFYFLPQLSEHGMHHTHKYRHFNTTCKKRRYFSAFRFMSGPVKLSMKELNNLDASSI